MPSNSTFVDSFVAVLVAKGFLLSKEYPTIIENFHKSDHDSFVVFLKNEEIVSTEHLLDALSFYYKVPAFDVVGYFFSHERLHEFPKDFLIRSGIIPLDRDENMLIVISHEPDNQDTLASIGTYVSYDIQFFVGFYDDICDAVKEFYDRALTEVTEDGNPEAEDPNADSGNFLI